MVVLGKSERSDWFRLSWSGFRHAVYFFRKVFEAKEHRVMLL